ncbi:MAG: Cell division protein ZapA [Syntrophorhabdus sp. PtaU1.Bin050]|nr:MAG: Cell division protein ZapA [Syntrophorhabdus sp. PtaU1.Bin050]
MQRKVEVSILNQPFTFIGEDERRIERAARFVDEKIGYVIKNYGIVNTMNAVIMAMMELSDEYLEMREKAEQFEGRALKLLRKVEAFEVPCGARDKW